VGWCLLPSISLSQELLWSTYIGGVYSESGFSGLQTSDGGYIILGNTYSYGEGEFDIYLVQTDSVGNTLWTRTFGGSASDCGYDITVTSDNAYVITGSTKSAGNGKKDVYLIKVSLTGDTIWTRTYGGIEDDEGRSVRQTHDNGLIICGSTASAGAGYSDLYLIKTDSLGDTIWTRTFGGVGGESGMSVRQTADSGYMAIGSTGSFGEGYSSIYVVRVDVDGDSLWATTYGGNRADMGYSVTCTPDGGYLFGGATASFGAGYSDGFLVRTDSYGDTIWTCTYGGSKDERIYSIRPAWDGSYLLTGTTDSYGAGKLDIYMIKIAPNGDTIWTSTYGGSNSDYWRAIFQEQGGGYILIGDSYSYTSGGSDIYLLKIQGEMTAVEDDRNDLLPSGYELAQNYPNPFNTSTTIEYTLPQHSTVNLTIYNILGQVVREWQTKFRQVGIHTMNWDGRSDAGINVASGVYFYRLTAGDYIETKKMVLLK
jgi:hypothetical protein